MEENLFLFWDFFRFSLTSNKSYFQIFTFIFRDINTI